jgi:hypothetical protein
MKTTAKKPIAKAQKGAVVKSTVKKPKPTIKDGNWSYDKTGKIKPIKKMAEGGASDECAQWPDKPGCKHSKAQRVNKRRKFWNSDAGKAIKKVGVGVAAAGAGTAAYLKNAFGVKDKVKELMGQQKGGPIKKKMQTGGVPTYTNTTKGEMPKYPGMKKGGATKKYQAGGGASIVAAMKKGGAAKKKK